MDFKRCSRKRWTSPEKLSLVVQAEVEETGATVEGHEGPHFTYITRAWGARWARSTL